MSISTLEQWYSHQCDGKWKHGSGMSQRTIAVLLGVEGNELIEHSFSLAIPRIPGLI
jgi:hypothetical protein